MREIEVATRSGARSRPTGAWRHVKSAMLVALAVVASAGACGEASGGAGQESGEADAAAGRGERRADTRGVTQGDGIGIDPATGQVVRRETIRVGGVPLTVEIADTPDLRSRGLMHRDSLPHDYGMLFVYAEPGILSFWMRNTLIPLDIAFIDANGTIVNIEQMRPQTDSQHVARAPSVYALETRQGWFSEHGIEPGDVVEF